MSERIQASRVSDRSASSTEETSSALQSVLETCDRIVRLKIPNFLRLYLNPFVAQTCTALSDIVHAAWPETARFGPRPSFLANSGTEALSGAIKLARYSHLVKEQTHSSPNVGVRTLLIDDSGIFGEFSSTTCTLPSGESYRVEFLPAIDHVTSGDFCRGSWATSDARRPRIVAIASVSPATDLPALSRNLRSFREDGGILIVCLQSDWEHSALVDRPADRATIPLIPDLVVFDQSFTNRAVPFGAFCATSAMYSQWTGRGMSAFHSTTYQPNTVSTMHFLKCLRENSPSFFEGIEPRLKPLVLDQQLLRMAFHDRFSPALTRVICAAGFSTDEVTASGHFVRAGGRRLFDGIGGVACSIRGHNPEKWVSEMERLGRDPGILTELRDRLHALTGLPHFVPATSGSSAVEQALKLGLVAQAPRRTVLTLKGGFGGKTLLALTGTSKPFYKQHSGPLYEPVMTLDPFAADAPETLRKIISSGEIALLQLELIQGVGGVRAIPAPLLAEIQECRKKHDFLVFVDEIQTGMFRTGPFVRSAELQFQPDLMTIGKGTSDMMFPFALTLFSDRVNQMLQQRETQIIEKMRTSHHFELGYRSLLNTLRCADEEKLSEQVLKAERCFQEACSRHLSQIPIVRDVRIFGLLIGIELELQQTLFSKLGLNHPQLLLAEMMQHNRFPLLMGYCQYEPSVLKFTPPLSVTSEEAENTISAVGDSLRCTSRQLLWTGIRALARTIRL